MVSSIDRAAMCFCIKKTTAAAGQSMNSGHYTTIALEGPGNWMKYDDGTVTQVSPAEAQKPDGYLLFYAVSE